MRIFDCKRKDVINICDGKRIGYVADIIFDPKSGCIEAIIVPGPCGICGFLGHEKEYIIPWKCVCQFGEDVVLVEVKLKDVEKPCKL